uniref:Uncharacterized protein n=1 Tax=Panagrolaimus sp. PS1159 TaxID=55785 RepID=A0AC35F5K1_9BILA
MKLFVFIFAIILLHAFAAPIQDGNDEIDSAEIRDVAIKTAKFKKSFAELHESLIEHPRVAEELAKAVQKPGKTMKSLGSGQQKNKKINKKIFGLIQSIFSGIGGLFG